MQENKSQIEIIKVIERLKSVYELHTDGALAEFFGVKQNTISTWRSRNSINYDLIFAKCDNLNFNWLLTGKGEPFAKNYKLEDKSIMFIDEPEIFLHPSNPGIPITDINVAAGNGGYDNPDYITSEDTIRLPENLLSKGRHICVRVKGESMSPTLQDSGFVVIRLLNADEWEHMRNEHVYVVSDKEGRSYLKRVKNRVSRGFITLMSDNPDKSSYPNFNFQLDEINTIWHVEWYLSAKMPNIHDQYYSRLERLEDKLDEISNHIKKSK